MRCSRFVDLGGVRHRHSDCQHGTGPVAPVPRVDASALRLRKAATDRQTETGAGALPVLRVHAVEFFEDPFEIARRYAGSFVENLDREGVAVAPRVHIDAAAWGRVFGGVVEQIE